MHGPNSENPGRSNVTARTSEQRYLVFSLADETYAIPLLQVREVIANTATTPIPHTPPHFRGIMNLRGQVISVIDMRMKFNLKKADMGPETSIIILDLPPLNLGIVVNSVDSVIAFEPSEISLKEDGDTSLSSDFLLGVARKDKKLILLLDVAQTLTPGDVKAASEQSKRVA